MRWILILVVLFLARSASAKGSEELPEIIDFDRRMSENYRLEILPKAAEYFGDKINHSFVVGGQAQVNLIPPLGIFFDFNYSRVSVDRTSLLGQSLTTHDLFLFGGGLSATKPAAYQSGKKAVEADLYSTIGGGVAQFNNGNRGMGFIGGGMKIRMKRIQWLAWTVDLKNYFFSIPNPSGSNFESDLTLMVGPTFLLFPEP